MQYKGLNKLDRIVPIDVQSNKHWWPVTVLGAFRAEQALPTLITFGAGVVASFVLQWIFSCLTSSIWHKAKKRALPPISNSVLELIGNTPMIRLNYLSKQTGCEILGKVEFLQPSGSTKDRVALNMITQALRNGQLEAGGLVTEGSVGSTGASVAMVAAVLGLRAFVAVPRESANEKAQQISVFGAQVKRVDPVSITHPDHYVHQAKRAAAEQNGVFLDQFNNVANQQAHEQTGDEIWRQTRGRIHGFVCGCGTGGTLSGVGRVLRQRARRRSGHREMGIQLGIVDPPGSSLYNKVTRGVMYAHQEAEGRKLRNPMDTIVEGVGINRMTDNFASIEGSIQHAYKCSDQEAVLMGRYLAQYEGIFAGGSSALNCVGAVKMARQLGPGHTIVTMLCDGGGRHLTRFYNSQLQEQLGLNEQLSGDSLDFVHQSE